MKCSVDWTVEMMACVEAGNGDGVQTCLSFGADPNAEDRHGRPMLCVASRLGHPRVVSKLIEAGASLSRTNRHLMTPLALAASSESLECVKELIRAGAPLELRDDTGRTPFLVAASTRRVDILEELLAAGANPLARDMALNTALMLSCSAMVKDHESFPVVKWLIQFGEIDSRNNWAQTPLSLVSRFGKKKCAQLLLESGASVAASGGLPSLLRKASEDDGFLVWLESLVLSREQSLAISVELNGDKDKIVGGEKERKNSPRI